MRTPSVLGTNLEGQQRVEGGRTQAGNDRLKRAESEPTRVLLGRSGVRAIAAVRGALMLVAQAAQRQRGGSGEAIIATRFRAALSAMQATVLSLYFLILSRVLR